MSIARNTNLTSCNLGKVASFGDFYNDILQGCSSLNSITYTQKSSISDDDYVLVDSNGNFDASGGTKTIYNGGFIAQYKCVKQTPSSGLTKIPVAFGNITIPNNVVSLPDFYDGAYDRGAFNSSSITSVNLGSVTSLGVNAFSNCRYLNSIIATYTGDPTGWAHYDGYNSGGQFYDANASQTGTVRNIGSGYSSNDFLTFLYNHTALPPN
jgi:hypothetical protein